MSFAHDFFSNAESMTTLPPDHVVSLPAAEHRRRAAIFVNHLRTCIATCKRTLVENLQEAQSEIAGASALCPSSSPDETIDRSVSFE